MAQRGSSGVSPNGRVLPFSLLHLKQVTLRFLIMFGPCIALGNSCSNVASFSRIRFRHKAHRFFCSSHRNNRVSSVSFLPMEPLSFSSFIRCFGRFIHLSSGSGSSLIWREVFCNCKMISILGMAPMWKGGASTMPIVDLPLISLISGGSVILNPLLCRTIVNTPIFISLFMLGGVT